MTENSDQKAHSRGNSMSPQTATQQKNTPEQDRVITWLTDAYAMESEGAKTCERHAEASGDYPELRSKLRQHARETRRHAEQVKSCLQRLEAQPSTVKEALGTVMGTVRGVATRASQDVVVKNVLTDCASEHFEIACYTSLIAAAEEVGDTETAQVCRDILQEEEAMAAFLAGQVGTVTQQFLRQEANDEAASSSPRSSAQQGNGLLKSAQQNILALAGAVATTVGAGLLLARTLGGDKNKEGKKSSSQPRTSGASMVESKPVYNPYDRADKRDKTVDKTVDKTDDSQTSGATISDLGSYARPLEASPASGARMSEKEQPTKGSESAASKRSPSDETADKVRARLKQNDRIDAGTIEVSVEENGRVTLEGTVDSEETKRLAREAITGILSISEIRNQLTVKAS